MTTTVLAYIPSPSQGVWHLGPFPIRAYALFIIIGIVAALVIGDRRWVARGGEPGVIYDIALWAVPFGLVGGRLYHVITDWRTYFGDDGAGFGAALRIWDGGLGIWGAVALGAIGAWIGCRQRGIPLPAFGDAIAPGIILAQAIGRLGNYFNQELFGRETTLPWGLEIYERVNSSGAPDSLNGVSTGRLLEVVHPTFLYELIWNLLVFAALIFIDRRLRIGHGRLFAMYVAGYCVGRFWVELMRSDVATHIAGIRVNSFTSTFVFIGAVVYIMAAPKGREDPETLRGKQDEDEHEESRVEELVKDLSVGASTAGVVAAAKVAAEDDEDTSTTSVADGEVGAEAQTPDIDDSADSLDATDGLGAVEGDEVGEAVAGAAVVHERAVEGEDTAEALTADTAESRSEEEAPEETPVVNDAAAEGEPAAEALAADTDEPESVDETDGLGAVEGDEVGEAVDVAAVAHEIAVEGEDAAEALTADSDEPESVDETDGLGAVEGDEVGEAVDEAAVAHERAVEGEDAAEALTADTGESRSEKEAPEETPVVNDAAVEGEPAAEALAADTDEPESVDETDGLGAVEGDEVGEAVAGAAVAHERAVEGEDAAEELTADTGEPDSVEKPPVDDEPAVAGTAATEASATEHGESETAEDTVGLGAVEGGEVGEAVDDAAVAHEIAVEGEDAAEALTADTGESEPAVKPPVDDEPAVTGTAATEASATEHDESETAEDTVGLGAVEADEVGEAVDEATVAHEKAVEGEDAAEALTAGAGGSDDSDSAEEAPVVNDAAIEGGPAAEALTDDGAEAEAEATEPPTHGDGPQAVDEDEDAAEERAPRAEPEPPVWTPSERTPIRATVAPLIAEAGGRAREWLRRRRNR